MKFSYLINRTPQNIYAHDRSTLPSSLSPPLDATILLTVPRTKTTNQQQIQTMSTPSSSVL